ncbi:hypothetical protein LTR53_006795 [Teratosphaeriaceae sp. CCFEE 6253]|nr:hypothetical protein LTR53_006795 [Teratosphaeriaceae sp. CCFEE 6253]
MADSNHVADLIHDSGVVLHVTQKLVEYEALSYCWGESEYIRLVTINEVPYPITLNLYQALQHLRHETKAQSLWVDAMCINQHETGERSLQVSNMVRIYSKAARVVVWLGDAGPAADLAIPLLLRRCPPDDIIDVLSRLEDDGHRLAKADFLASYLRALQHLCMPHLHDFSRGLQDLLERPWYRRAWILQEIWAAQDVLVRCGPHALRFCHLLEAGILLHQARAGAIGRRIMVTSSQHLLLAVPTDLATLDGSEPRSQSDPHGSSDLSWLMGLLGQARAFIDMQRDIRELSRQSRPLLFRENRSRLSEEVRLEQHDLKAGKGWAKTGLISELLRRSSACNCTDPRDHIYAVLAMADPPVLRTDRTPTSFMCMTVDYSKSVAEVFMETTRYLMWLYGVGNILSGRGTVYGGSCDGDSLPSWCVDWSRSVGELFIDSWEPEQSTQDHNRHTFATGSRTLRLKGVRVGNVKLGSAHLVDHTGEVEEGDLLVLSQGLSWFNVPNNPARERTLILRRIRLGAAFAFVGMSPVDHLESSAAGWLRARGAPHLFQPWEVFDIV